MSLIGRLANNTTLSIFGLSRNRGHDLWRELRSYQGKLASGLGGEVLMDVGANFGQTVENMVRAFPHASIHAFEPCPETFGTLLSKTASFKNVYCVQAACGDKKGRQRLNLTEFSTTDTLVDVGVVSGVLVDADT